SAMKSRAILRAGAAAIALAAASVSGREAAPSFRILDRATVEAIAQRSHRSLSDEERQELNATIKAGLDFRAWMGGQPGGPAGGADAARGCGAGCADRGRRGAQRRPVARLLPGEH